MAKPITRNDLEAAVIKRAIMDGEFRKQLMADGRSAIDTMLRETFACDKLPEKLEVKVIEEPANGFYLVLPPRRGELSDDELEQAAGGRTQIHIEFPISA